MFEIFTKSDTRKEHFVSSRQSECSKTRISWKIELKKKCPCRNISSLKSTKTNRRKLTDHHITALPRLHIFLNFLNVGFERIGHRKRRAAAKLKGGPIDDVRREKAPRNGPRPVCQADHWSANVARALPGRMREYCVADVVQPVRWPCLSSAWDMPFLY